MNKEINTIENKILNGEELTETERKYCAWGEIGKYVEKIEGECYRWTRDIQTIFKIGEQYYAIDWASGLTEYQDNEDWGDPYKVERKEEVVTTTVVSYVPVEE